MAITWKTLLRRRGNASLKEYTVGRGIINYEQLCDSFNAHGLAPPTREESGDLFQEETEIPLPTPPESSREAGSEEPAAEVLYETEGDRRRRHRKENFEKANKSKGK